MREANFSTNALHLLLILRMGSTIDPTLAEKTRKMLRDLINQIGTAETLGQTSLQTCLTVLCNNAIHVVTEIEIEAVRVSETLADLMKNLDQKKDEITA